MNSREVALQAIAALSANTIPYMLVGSFSTNFYGMERSTEDAGIVVELGGRSIGDVFRSLGRDFRCARWAARAHRPKDEQDVAAVLSVQRGRLDLAYIRQWCDTHGSRSTFESIFEAVESKFA